MRSEQHARPGLDRADLLRGLRVGISGAVPEAQYWKRPNQNEQILSFVGLLADLVMKYGGRVVHGNHPSLTPIIVGRADKHFGPRADGEPPKAPLRSPLVTLVASELWPLAWEFPLRPEVVEVIRTPRLGAGDAADAETRNRSLTALRLALVENVDVMVAVGGKLHRGTGFNPGVLEELTIARWFRVPCFICAGYGGLAGEMDLDVILECGVGNGLDREEQQRLASPDQEIDLLVGGIVAHLARLAERWRTEAPPKWGLEIPIHEPHREGDVEVRAAEVAAPMVDSARKQFVEVVSAMENADAGRIQELLENPPQDLLQRSSTTTGSDGVDGTRPTKVRVQFEYLAGIKREVFGNVRLTGSWDASGRRSDQWSSVPMTRFTAEDGCPAYRAVVDFDPSQVGEAFRWGVVLDGPAGVDRWGVATEVHDASSTDQTRSFRLQAPAAGGGARQERYYLTHNRRLGAQKYRPEGADRDGICFAVWAPNAQKVEVVMGEIWDVHAPDDRPKDGPMKVKDIAGGYISDHGDGVRKDLGPFPMTRQPDGVWIADASTAPALADFAPFDHRLYMFRITKDDGSVAYRTDLYSRCQVGFGQKDPKGEPFEGLLSELDGSVSCSAVVDPDRVTKFFEEPNGLWPEPDFIDADEFWKDEDQLIGAARPRPKRVADLVIYEMHIGALGPGGVAGTLKDAIDLLDYLVDLGVNAVELLPLSEFGGEENWGYATSHYFAIEYVGGGRDKYKFFIKECHRRGIAVIFDVVYNHFTHHGERSEWMYDTNDHARNCYYWYEGRPSDYPDFDRAAPEQAGRGGYVDNMSTNFAPRYYEEMVRKMFLSSAVMLMEEFHVDGFRFDQTTSIHAYNVLHADGRPVASANQFGAKLLREVTRTLKLINPDVILTAEDHSNWDKVTQPPDVGGLGFDAAWYADFYHHLIGDTDHGSDYAKLIKTAGFGDDRPLAMGYFAGALASSGANRVVYNESHDEAGNGQGTKRTIVVASNGAPLVGDTRRYAEARCRFAFGTTALSAGTPMFLFGEEVGAQQDFLYNKIFRCKVDLRGDRAGVGKHLFAFYGAMIRLRLDHPGLRSRSIDVLHVHDENRVLAWHRWGDGEDFLVLASLNNHPFRDGYTVSNPRLPDGLWKEVFNSDSAAYGGDDAGNFGAAIPSGGGSIRAVIPANGLVVLQRVS